MENVSFNLVRSAALAFFCGKLHEVKTLSSAVYVSDGNIRVSYSIENGDETYVLDANKVDFFASNRQFEKSEPIIDDVSIKSLITRCVNTYYYDGKQARKLDLDDDMTIYPNEWKIEIDGVIYDKSNTYETTEDCYKFNPYIYVDASGAEKVVEARYKQIMLTDEQRKALDEVRDAMQKAADLGVNFYYDMEDYNFYAFNGSKVDDINWEGRSSREENDFCMHDIDRVRYTELLHVTDINCDTNIVMKKD